MTMTTELAHMPASARTAELAVPTRPGPLRRAFHRILQAIREMDYASHRLVAVQAPWAVDAQWHNK